MIHHAVDLLQQLQELNLRSKQAKNATDLIVATLWGSRRRCRIRVLLISRICHTPPPCAIHLLLPRVKQFASRCFYCHTQHPIPGLRGILLRPNPRSPNRGRIPQPLCAATAERCRRNRHRQTHKSERLNYWREECALKQNLIRYATNSISR